MSSTQEATVVAPSGKRDGHWASRLNAFAPYAALRDALAANPIWANTIAIGVPVVWVLVWNIAPLVEMLRISFLHEFPARVNAEQMITAEHYVRLVTDPTVYGAFIRTMVFGLAVVAGTFIVTLPIAYFIAKRAPANWQMRLLMLVLIPSWVNEIIRVFSYVLLFASNGGVNLVLQTFGLVEKPIPFLYNWFSLSAGTLYVCGLFMLIPLYSALERIPNSLLEAASDLGATSLQRFFRVTLPLIRDGIATGAVLVFLISVGLYTVPSVLSGPDTNLFSQVISESFYDSNLAWPSGAAYSIAMFVVALIIAGALNFFIRQVGRRS